MESVDDLSVWSYAKEYGLVIVSKDSDFRQFSFTYGHPPKVVWIRRGNCSTAEVDHSSVIAVTTCTHLSETISLRSLP